MYDDHFERRYLLRLLTTGYGTSRQLAAAQQFGRIWSEADMRVA
jgi:hypothetical protein